MYRLTVRDMLPGMASFAFSFMRVDRDEHPTVVEMYFREVDWPCVPREGEAVDLGIDLSVPVFTVGYDFEGRPGVVLGRVVLSDLQALQLKKVGWRVEPLPPDLV